MADVELVIKINKDTWKRICDSQSVPDMSGIDIINGLNAVKEGTPLPRGHGRLIDADSIHQIIRPIEQSDAEWGMTAETAIQLIHSAFNKAPTIIERSDSE